MTFPTDVTDDVDDVFLNSLEFAELVDVRAAATDTTTVGVLAEVEDEGDTVLDDGAIFRVSSAVGATLVKGDQFIRGGAVFTIFGITEEVEMFIFDCEREEPIT